MTSPEPFDLERPSRVSYLVGVYLATNAIADAATVIDGPDCAFFKAEYIHGRHDLNSTLLDVLGRHRILVSHTTADNIARSQGQDVVARIRDAERMPGVGVVLVTALPMVSIIGLQYDQLIRDLRAELSVDIVQVPALSLQGDWLDGYAETLAALATGLPVGEAPPSSDSVSILGYFMDRNEEDHRANVAELRRLVEALGLKLDALWLSGRPWSELRRAVGSATLLALPLGQPAATILAEKTGAKVVAVDTPFGLTRTADFVRALGEATNRQREAEDLVQRELAQSAARLEWAVPHFFLGLRLAVSATPDLLPGFCDIAGELGMEIVELVSPARCPAWFDQREVGGRDVFFDGRFVSQKWHGGRSPDLVLGDSNMIHEARDRWPVLEFGFPSYEDHALFDRPYLGFRGHAALVQRILSALAHRGRSPGSTARSRG